MMENEGKPVPVTSERVQILLIEDDAQDARIVQEILHKEQRFPHSLKWVTTVEEGLRLLKDERFDVVLSDLCLPDCSGLRTVQSVITQAHPLPVIVVTGSTDNTLANQALLVGVQDYLLKNDLSGPNLVKTIQHSISRAKSIIGILEPPNHTTGEGERRFRTIFESEPECVKLVGPDGILLDMNQAGLSMLEVEQREEAIGKSFLVWIPAEWHEPVKKGLEGVFRGNPFVGTFEIVGKKGTRRWMETHAVPLRNEAGQITTMLAVTRDISKQKQAEEGTKLDERRLQSVVKISQQRVTSLRALLDFALEEAINLSDSKIGYIYYYNEEKQEFTLHAWSHAVMAECSIPNPPTVYQLGKTGLWGEAIRQRRPIVLNDFTAPNPLKKGYPEWHSPLFRFMTIPVFSEGHIIAVVGVANKENPYSEMDVRQLTLMMDSVWKIAERQQAEEELRHHRDHLEELVKARTNELEQSNKDLEHFAYVASHDLQEPLRKVVSFLQLLDQDYASQLDSRAKEFVDMAIDGGKRMKQMISDLLEYSRISSRNTPLAAESFEEILRDALMDLEVSIQENHAVITHSPLPTLMVNNAQMKQVFVNLVGNAVKFRREEDPRVHISAREDGDFWEFAVRDNGIGIDMTQVGRLFKIFQRLHPRDKYPGTGIGLSSCKRIVERHGGRIWVESEIGRGSTFYFSIPTKAMNMENETKK